jgi:hypothetical protein
MKETVCAWMAEWILVRVEWRKCMQLNEWTRRCLINSIDSNLAVCKATITCGYVKEEIDELMARMYRCLQ